MKDEQASQRHQEHHPAGKLVKESERLIRVPVLDTQSRTENPHSVGGNRNRNAGQREYGATREGSFEEVSIEYREREQADQGADAAACLGDFQLHYGKYYYVSVAKN